jgi:hypothetical protein
MKKSRINKVLDIIRKHVKDRQNDLKTFEKVADKETCKELEGIINELVNINCEIVEMIFE